MTLPGFTESDTNTLALAYYHLKIKDANNIDWDAIMADLDIPTLAAAKKRLERAMKKTLEEGDGSTADAGTGAEADGGDGKKKKKGTPRKVKGTPVKKGTAAKVKTPSKRKLAESEDEVEEDGKGAAEMDEGEA